MDGDVRQDNLVPVLVFLNHIRPHVVYVRDVVLELKDVVVTTNQDKSTCQSTQGMNTPATNTDIAQKVNAIEWADEFIVDLYEMFIVFFDRLESRTTQFVTLSVFKVQDICVPEVVVGTDPSPTTHFGPPPCFETRNRPWRSGPRQWGRQIPHSLCCGPK
jgi:hypothetical protein